MHGDNITITMSRSEANLLNMVIGRALQGRLGLTVEQDEALCEIQDTIADALEG